MIKTLFSAKYQYDNDGRAVKVTTVRCDDDGKFQFETFPTSGDTDEDEENRVIEYWE